jgi:hypothetical protein
MSKATPVFSGNILQSNTFVSSNTLITNAYNNNDIGKYATNVTSTFTIRDDNSNVLVNLDLPNKSFNLSKDCDLKLGNISIRTFLERIEQRLEILHINPELESQWDELKELGDRYRQLEKELLEKNKVWDILKKT